MRAWSGTSAPGSLLSATLFYMDLKNYIGYGSQTLTYVHLQPRSSRKARWCLTCSPSRSIPRVVSRASSSPTSSSSPITSVWRANYTYTDGKQIRGDVVATATTTAWSAPRRTLQRQRLLREYALQRARVLQLPLLVLQRPGSQHGLLAGRRSATLSASLAWTFNENFSLTLDGQNLNNPTLKYYALNEPRSRARSTQRPAVLPDPAREVLSTSGRHGGRSRAAASPARRSASPRTLVPRSALALGAPRGRTGNVPARQDELSSPHRRGTHDDRHSFQPVLWRRAPGADGPRRRPASGASSSSAVARPGG